MHRQFLVDGVLTIPVTELPQAFHDELHAQAEAMWEKGASPGNNIYPQLGMLRDVLEGPTVAGALTSLLGPGFAMHNHRHMVGAPAAPLSRHPRAPTTPPSQHMCRSSH